MLLGQQFGRRHQGGLIARMYRSQRGERGHHGLAAADVALHQAQHRLRLRQVARHFLAHALLRRGEAERQCAQQLPMQLPRRAQHGRTALPHRGAQALEAQVLGQQLFEGEPLLGRVATEQQLAQVRIRRRSVHVKQRIAQRGQAVGAAQRRRNQLQLPGRRQQRQRLADHRGQALLAQAFGGGIHRTELLVYHRGFAAAQALVARVHHLQPLRGMAHLAVAEQPRAWHQLFSLRAIEVEEAQQQGLRAGIADRHLELRAIAEAALDGLDHALDLRAFAGAQVRDRGDARLVLVA